MGDGFEDPGMIKSGGLEKRFRPIRKAEQNQQILLPANGLDGC
jgi:hypothetical protein